jgi:hypothetical protein
MTKEEYGEKYDDHLLERHLPFRPHDTEWEIVAKRKGGKRYLGLSKIEQYVSLLIAIPFLVLLVYLLFKSG